MSVTDARRQGKNDLYRLAAVIGLLLVLFFAAGASGHLAAVWPMLIADSVDGESRRIMLLLPGLVLAGTALVNLLLSIGLWGRRPLANRLALIFNAGSAGYLIYLLAKGVPGHPIGFFLTLVSCQLLLLIAIAVGLVWPGPDATAKQPPEK